MPASAPVADGALPILSAAGFASMASIRVADAMLPAMARDFGVEPTGAAATITLFALGYGAFQLVWGPLGDRLGKLRLIAWAALAAAAGSIACAAAPTLASLSIARLLTGACCAAIIPLSIAFIGDTVDDVHRQATLARLSTGTLSGMIAGQLLGGVAADTVGWRGAFALLALLLAVAGAAALRRLLQHAGGARPVPPPVPLAALSLAGGWVAVLGDAWARRVLAVAFIEGVLVFGALAFVPTWLHERADLSLAAAGGAVAAVGLGGLLFALTARWLIPALGQQRMLALGGAAVGLGFLALAVSVRAPAGPPTWTIALVACGVAGLGLYMLHNTLQTLATGLAPRARGTAIGLFAVSLFVGQSLGVTLAAGLGGLFGHAPVIVAAGLGMAALGAWTGAALARRRSD